MESVRTFDIDKILSRFNRKITIAPNGCHEWIGSLQSNGYGRFNPFGKSMYAHRFAALMKFGIVTTKIDVCHKCDNRKCVNPDHLFLGTRKENMQDAVAKGRQARGEKLSIMRRGENCKSSKLTWESVRKIRDMKAAGVKTSELADQFKVSMDNIRKIVRFNTWKEI